EDKLQDGNQEEQGSPQGGQSLDDWLAAERSRLDRGYQFEPKPTTSDPASSGTIETALAGVGLGAGVVAGAAAPHPNPTTFQGVKPTVIINALREELADRDTKVQVNHSSEAVEVTILQSQDQHPFEYLPAVTATMIDKDNTLTVTISDLSQSSVRTTLGSMGNAVLRQGKSVLVNRRLRGPGGLIDAAGNVLQGVSDVVEDIQDLRLPSRVWKVVDRVGNAAEHAYLDEQARINARDRAREQALRAWTHCPYCDRGYDEDEDHLTQCPACGGTRGDKLNS
ncbi:MAG: hypothetical protein MUQ10_12985, partial [Anaerolineae bacterium]|nr:hypothetical protein [Anaerolineae bacterium]